MTMPKNLTDSEKELWKISKRIEAKEWQKSNPEKAKARKKAWYLKNRELTIKRSYINKNKGKVPTEKKILTEYEKYQIRTEYMKNYYKNNKEKIITRWLQAKKTYSKNPLFRLKEALRTRIRTAIFRNGYSKKGTTFSIVGCCFDEFVLHIESQFDDEMKWENFGEWHIDHKVPLVVAENEDELLKLNHYTNLQPLWAADNLSKNKKMLPEFLTLKFQLIGR